MIKINFLNLILTSRKSQKMMRKNLKIYIRLNIQDRRFYLEEGKLKLLLIFWMLDILIIMITKKIIIVLISSIWDC